MVDRIFSGNDISSGVGTKTVTFTNPFKNNSICSWYYNGRCKHRDFFTVSNKTVNSFDVLFKNSSGSNISRTFDFIEYLLKGV